MYNELFQSVILQMKQTVYRTFGVLDGLGFIIVCSDITQIGKQRKGIIKIISYEEDVFIHKGSTYKIIGLSQNPDYAVFVEGDDDLASIIAKILVITLFSIKKNIDERYDKSTFIKNIILDSIAIEDIFCKAKMLNFNIKANRVVILIRLIDNSSIFVKDILQKLFPKRTKDYIININETDIAIVKEVNPSSKPLDLENFVLSIVDTLYSEFYIKTIVGIGTIVMDIKEIAQSFKEAQNALEISFAFDSNKNIFRFDNLGIKRLIYSLPTSICEEFLNEVFKKSTIEYFSQETLNYTQMFFENTFNVAETSKKLFIHRDTLILRLEKIKNITGLDLKEFNQAIIFKFALLIKKYMTNTN